MKALPEILTLRDRLARPRPTLQYRIDGLQAIGHRVLLAAQFKVGKTTLVANVSRSLLDGDAFLGRYAVAPIDGTLAVLDFEMASTQLDQWYQDQHVGHDDRLILVPMKGQAASFNIVDPIVRSRWALELKARGVTYLMIDCLRPLLDALGLNEHTQAGLLLTALDALLYEAGIAEALVVHHMGHNGKRARGDSRLGDWPDATWSLDGKQDSKAPRYFTVVGRDVEVPKVRLAYDRDTRRLTLACGSQEAGGSSEPSAAATAAIQDRILSCVAGNPGLTANRLAETTKIRKVDVYHALEALTTAGKVEGVRSGPTGKYIRYWAKDGVH